jgi:hypothetical protein
MALPDYVGVIYCKYSNDEHISEDPILLPCGSSACRQCYSPTKICSKCKTVHNIKIQTHSKANDLIKEYIDKLDEDIIQKFTKISLNIVEGKKKFNNKK